jgi:hypothetical protein
MTDFKTRFNEIIKIHAKPGFAEEYQSLLKILAETSPISTFKKSEVILPTNTEKQNSSLKLWSECCLEKTGRKVVKKTDPEYQDVKAYFITRKENKN